ncbi:hypothetical protein [Chelativorans salis]|uniref:Uncharacterized protein n=1 Tax=Chelativorans salis TaxID=2978478 RepID=A0ABT2LN91_9HYPH|nr:hypothetical protein [Chelativorans sp. EGI FJ00035]MCT7375539.1 hypothetical protein [Chelativorans sp. EGI FJ00035]
MGLTTALCEASFTERSAAGEFFNPFADFAFFDIIRVKRATASGRAHISKFRLKHRNPISRPAHEMIGTDDIAEWVVDFRVGMSS